MPLTRLILVVAFAALTTALALPVVDIEARVAEQCGPDYCAGIPFSNETYVCGDPRLGPKKLPTKLPLDIIVNKVTYDRLGGLCPAAFITTWWLANSSAWNYPPDAGFQLSSTGVPISANQTLLPGEEVDRFGSEYGSFLAPADTPYMQRSLPPQSLDTPAGDPTYPYNYHIYRVVNAFQVLSGPIAPWFGQPGQGVQYQTSANVMTLIQQGYLERVDLKTHPSPRD